MLYMLAEFSEGGGILNLLRYITVRSGGALLTSLLIGFLLGPPVTACLQRRFPQGNPIRDDGPDHDDKAGTPTMGGILILFSMTVSLMIWARLDNLYVWVIALTGLAFAGLGMIDDLSKLKHKSSRGVPGRLRLLVGLLIGGLVGWAALLLHPAELSGVLTFPFVKDLYLPLGFLFIALAALVVAGSANFVNLTDGLDGLAIVPIMIAGGALGVIAYAVGRIDFANYLGVLYVAGAGELTVITASLIGAGLGFLWYNAPPASIFMGDTGSLGLGGTIGAIAVLIKHEIIYAIIGGLFVVTAISVMIQVFYFRLTGKRFFRMAPLHHHFEKQGWQEPQIVIRFWIIALILALLGLVSLKVR
ncbi:MAG: phospho-N-acetylmuramoyl-pentapeptide-transferase [Rhodobacteraceae bacterium]|nr:phospho-N-acetylmuramoyl-pentapeptide-transferase [Paracoccaceae bacterium]